MKINSAKERLFGGIYEYVENIVTKAMQENRRLIIWGCGRGGSFLGHLIHDVDGRMEVSYFIDEHIIIPCNCEKADIFRSSLLCYLHPEEYIVLLTIRRDEEAERKLSLFGYKKDKDYFDMRDRIGGSYLEYLEMHHEGIDFSYVTKEDCPDIYSGDYFESKPFDHSSVDRVFEELSILPCDKHFFDIGCGKGQMLLMAAINEMEKIGGIEFNQEIACIARSNMKVLQIGADIITGDATVFSEIDDYNIFFLYNPFGKESIKKVVSNLLESHRRKLRSIFIVYGNPFYHAEVIACREITIHRQVRVNLYDPILNIYRIGK